jgi:HK97 gp10 family phage protein
MFDTKINTNDLKKLQKKFKTLEQFSKKDAVQEMNRAIMHAHRLAVSAAPVAKDYGGTLKQSIKPEALKDGAELVAYAEYAPYVEFGTGSGYVKVNDATKLGIPEKYIKQFKGRGIKEINMAPQPFFYGSVAKAYKNMLMRIEKRLKRIVNE